MSRTQRVAFNLIGTSLLAGGLLALRMALTQTLFFGFLAYNLALAWTPLALGALFARLLRARRDRIALPVGVAYALFFPNAFYLVTDVIHLKSRDGVPLWFDATLFMVFAFAGTGLALAALGLVHRAIAARFGGRAGWLAAVSMALLSGFGIFLGRVERLNSWDVVTRPVALIERATSPLLRPFDHLGAWLMTLVLGGLLASLHIAVHTGPRAVDVPGR